MSKLRVGDNGKNITLQYFKKNVMIYYYIYIYIIYFSTIVIALSFFKHVITRERIRTRVATLKKNENDQYK